MKYIKFIDFKMKNCNFLRILYFDQKSIYINEIANIEYTKYITRKIVSVTSVGLINIFNKYYKLQNCVYTFIQI